MIGTSHLLRRVSQVWVTIGALVQQLILLVASYSVEMRFLLLSLSMLLLN